MKTLTKKRPEAGGDKAGRASKTRNLSGAYSTGLWNDAHAALLGKIAGSMPQVEELMIDLTALLLGDAAMPARPIFRGLAGDEARVNVLRALLERGEANTKKGPAFDAAIAGYAGARRRWRAYIQGLWYTHENGRTFLAAPSGDAASFLVAREVKMAELEAELDHQASRGMYLAIFLIQVKQEYEGMAKKAAEREKDPALIDVLMKPWMECEAINKPLDLSRPMDLLKPHIFLAFRGALIDVRNNLGMGAMEAKKVADIEKPRRLSDFYPCPPDCPELKRRQKERQKWQ